MRKGLGYGEQRKRTGDEERATMGLENVNLTAYSQEHGPTEGHGQLLEGFGGKAPSSAHFETHSRSFTEKRLKRGKGRRGP